MLHLLTFTNLYPNRVQPRHGIFVEQRLRKLLNTGRVQATVIAPVPWFPSANPRFGKYAVFAAVPARERRHGIDVLHPRYPVIPLFGAPLAPALMAACVQRTVRRLIAGGTPVDLIDAHYFYPDGVAAVMIGKLVGRPVVVTARGSDLNVLGEEFLPRCWIRWAQRSAAACVTVSDALKRKLVELGASDESVTVLRNGVDLDMFHPVNAEQARRSIGMDGEIMLAVGNLIRLKGQHVAISALRELANVKLVIVGGGEMRDDLERLAQRLGVADRVLFAGDVPQDDLGAYYSAATCSVLLSEHEGMPNVVLESLACGTPVIATRVGGIPEVINGSAAGILLDERTPAALVAAFRELRAARPAREATRRHAEQFDWEDTTRGQEMLLRQVAERAGVERHRGARPTDHRA